MKRLEIMGMTGRYEIRSSEGDLIISEKIFVETDQMIGDRRELKDLVMAYRAISLLEWTMSTGISKDGS